MKYKNPQSVLVVIYCSATRNVLMLQRQDDLSFWQSVTGSIENGETPTHAAIREVKEETGFDIFAENLPLFDCNQRISFEIFPQFRYKYAPDITHCTEHWFLLGLENESVPTLTEHQAYQWVTVQQAAMLTKSWNNRAAIETYLSD
ncbi:dihydroneopterin triphosphate diphosphatase [[Pasteurella] aerogenes]|nr:dihydroneopterin triphosphate diphosphatase [[Pasteurella] aerogenes]MDY2797517.1 dihydroneopterin triphosphate diphosphatase [[Pasteurella] aerogenes]